MQPKSILMYVLFFMTAVFVFASLLFPGKEVATYLSHSLKNKNFHLSMDNVKFVFPNKLKFENTQLYMGQDINQKIQITPESFKVSINPVVLFKQEKQIQFESDFYQGLLKGHFRVKNMDPFLFLDGAAVMAGVKISKFRYTTDLADITLGCELNGEFNATEEGDQKDSGHGTLLVQNFFAEMQNSLFNSLSLPKVDFSEIKLEYIQKHQTISIEQCAARGSIINIKLKGQIELIFPVQKSRVNLSGVILPDSPYLAKFANFAAIRSVVKNIQKDGIKFNIKGVLENPKIGI